MCKWATLAYRSRKLSAYFLALQADQLLAGGGWAHDHRRGATAASARDLPTQGQFPSLLVARFVLEGLRSPRRKTKHTCCTRSFARSTHRHWCLACDSLTFTYSLGGHARRERQGRLRGSGPQQGRGILQAGRDESMVSREGLPTVLREYIARWGSSAKKQGPGNERTWDMHVQCAGILASGACSGYKKRRDRHGEIK